MYKRQGVAGDDAVHVGELGGVPQDGDGVERVGLGVGEGGHRGDVLLADAVEVLGDAHPGVHALDPVDEVGAGPADAGGLGELSELGLGGCAVGAQDVGEGNGVREAVRLSLIHI